jgi:8-oxo-dGTP diphosphatase
VLITRRPDRVHQGGLWEFPGGKLDPGESPAQGLIRELREELGIAVHRCEPLIRVAHDYGDRQVLLDVFRVCRFAGEPRGLEGQPLRWEYPERMRAAEFPAADRPVINALRLPDRMLITGSDPRRPQQFLRRLLMALEGVPPLVQLRAPGLAPAEFQALAGSVASLCRERGVKLVLNGPVEPSLLSAAAGLHVNAVRLMALKRRPAEAADEGMVVGASCHNERELQHAAALGLDYALLSPVALTASHPQAIPLGWERFADWVARVNLPVYALGGMGIADIPTAKHHGAQGVAAIRGLWPTGT